jgi:purine-binding chemotaxis protein CheW
MPEQQSELHLVSFRVGGRLFGVDIMRVHRVLLAERLLDVPGAPPHVSGMIEVHGQLVGVVDLPGAMGLEAAESGQLRLVVVRLEGERLAAFNVDEVVERVRLQRTEVLDPPPGLLAEAVTGAFHHGEELGLILDPARLFAGQIADLPRRLEETA